MGLDGWQVPEHPEQANVDRARRRRLMWGWIGAMVGFLANLAIVLVGLGPMVAGAEVDSPELAGLVVIFYTVVASVGLLIVGGLLCIGRPVRPVGVGLLIGTGAGLIVSNGVCATILAVLT